MKKDPSRDDRKKDASWQSMPWDGEPKVKNRRIVDEVIDAYYEAGSTADPLGMYTGHPHSTPAYYDAESVKGCADGKRYIKPNRTPEHPTQDADDL